MTGAAEWIPIAVAVIAAASTIAVQVWVNRGEPAAIKQIKLLNEAIGGMPLEDPGTAALIEARSLLAVRLSTSLVGVSGFARILRRSGWIAVVAGSIGFVVWFLLALLSPAFAKTDSAGGLVSTSLLLFGTGPVLIFYSSLWPQFNKALDSIVDVVQKSRKSKTASNEALDAGGK